jgi:hypothetical protein
MIAESGDFDAGLAGDFKDVAFAFDGDLTAVDGQVFFFIQG